MHKFGVLTALALSWATASCADRVVNPVDIPQLPLPKTAPNPRSNTVEESRRTETTAESARNRPAIRSHPGTPSASLKPKQPHRHQAALPRRPLLPTEIPIEREPSAGVVLPSHSESTRSDVPIAALMPPSPEPAEATFPLTPPIELPSPEPPTSTPPRVPSEAATPPPTAPADPDFPAAALMPLPPEPAEPSLPSQEQIAGASSISIPFPDLPSYLSLRPRFDWVDTVGTIDIPPSPLPEALDVNSDEDIPNLIRSPWPLPLDGT
jgi:hypothetical protein